MEITLMDNEFCKLNKTVSHEGNEMYEVKSNITGKVLFNSFYEELAIRAYNSESIIAWENINK